MQIIEGLEKAKARLSRRETGSQIIVTPGLLRRIKDVFGEELSPEQVVMKIIEDVRRQGDRALRHYTTLIDKVNPEALEVDSGQIESAYNQADKKLISALKLAARRIKAFHQAQQKIVGKGVKGKEWGQMVRPLVRVGIYAPGGTASYPSTVLMTIIPAKVAGVKEIILVTPPGANGKIPAATLVAADIAGADRIFSIGGAQAIAALAFGTESVPKVDKICGPGNIFVTLAKKAVYGTVDIDGFYGPSEVLIIADGTADPSYVAADLLAQAEHDALSQPVLVTTSKNLAEKVNKEMEQQLADLPRKKIATESLEDNGVIAVVANMDEALELANRYAPEHLELMVKDAARLLERVTAAGCIFVGDSSPVALGDYVAGPSHVLPTGGTARFSSPLNVLDFIKLIDIVKISRENLPKLAKATAIIARAEGLEAHARAAERRMENIKE